MVTNVVDQLAEALAPAMDRLRAKQFGISYSEKHDISNPDPISVGFSHGNGGLFTFPGVDPTLFHTVMGASSILGQMNAMSSLNTNPTYMTVTGVLGDTGNEKDAPCEDAPVAGLAKGCIVTSVFGRYERATPQLEINRLGQRNDRADPLDLQLVGSPIDSAGPFGFGSTNAPGDVLTNEVSRKFWELSISFHRLLSRQLWNGNPANNTGAGGYKELTGFSLLVNTGYHDAETGVACAAMDSYLSNFGSKRIDASDSQIVAAITNMYHQVYRRAELTGVLPVRWVMVMRSQMFYELTSIWPCSYYSYRCAVSPGFSGDTNMRGNIDAVEAAQLRDAMRAGRYLLIDGQRIEVILDEGINEDDGTESGSFPRGCFRSDIYLIPMSVVGGRSVTYMEYFDLNNPSIDSAFANMFIGRRQGPFLVWPRQTNECIQWQAKVEPRLIMRTPWLAARLQNVVYCPIEHERESFPDDPYFVDGGRTNRVAKGPSYFQLWAS